MILNEFCPVEESEMRYFAGQWEEGVKDNGSCRCVFGADGLQSSHTASCFVIFIRPWRHQFVLLPAQKTTCWTRYCLLTTVTSFGKSVTQNSNVKPRWPFFFKMGNQDCRSEQQKDKQADCISKILLPQTLSYFLLLRSNELFIS